MYKIEGGQMTQLQEYFSKALDGCNPVIGVILSAISYLLFPDEAFFTSIVAVGMAMILDILTKFWALAKQNDGYREAVKTRAIYSKTLWDKTKIKLFSYLVIMILAGCSYRVAPLQKMGVFFATVVYAVMFLREGQSVVENLVDGGADLRWLLFWVKKKQRQILESEVDEFDQGSPGKDDDYEMRV
ncbi:MAG: phage holin family protein [Desulfosporosinus sp.]|nr:phage holin family protein [Desulfosporosinus sp.]